jgi:ABC-type long-subunit fatty acid transport system fused permease/ATPase subunit
MLLGELKKPLVYSQNGVTFAAPKTTKGLFFGDVHRHFERLFLAKEKNRKK